MRLRDDHEDYYDRKLERDRECAFLALNFCGAMVLVCALLALAAHGFLLPGAVKIDPQPTTDQFFTKSAPGSSFQEDSP